MNHCRRLFGFFFEHSSLQFGWLRHILALLAFSGLTSAGVAQTAPRITSQPKAQSVVVGASVSFSVSATGSLPLSYTWMKNGVVIAGANSAVYSIPAVVLTHAGSYSVVVGNSVANVLSATVNLSVTAPVLAPPTITQHPQSQTVLPGASINFISSASGAAPLSYQWTKNGAPIEGATKSSLTLSSVSSSDAANYAVLVSNPAANAISSAAVLTVSKPAPTAPSITSNPQPQTITTGAAVVFSVVAAGTTPLSYQWKRDGLNVAGATNTSLEIAAAGPEHAGFYTVVISNEAASVLSAPVLLSVNAPVAPFIGVQPQTQTVTRGATANFSVVATGTAPLSYQWKLNGDPISGATKSNFSRGSAQEADSGNYAVVVSNAVGSVISDSVSLTVLPPTPPSITVQPQSVSVVEGSAASFVVSAAGTAPFSYQWKFNGANVPGATSASFSRNPAVKAHEGVYSVSIENAAGSVDSGSASLAVTQPKAASVATHPVSRRALVGSTVSLTVVADGTPPLAYQWRKDGANITGATQDSFTIGSVGLADAGSYSAVVSNKVGTASSNAASLSVEVPQAPKITLQPNPQTLEAGVGLTLSASASGTEPLSYQWQKNGAPIAGATRSAYSITAASAADSGSYQVVVANPVAMVNSNLVIVTVRSAVVVVPTISKPPLSQSVGIGSRVSLSVIASGTEPLSYQWRKNGNNIPGATQANLVILSAASVDEGTYSVAVSNSAAMAISSGADLRVKLPVAVAPSITTQPISQSVASGFSVTFSVVATGTEPLAFQWRKDGSAIAGATSSSFKIPAAASSDSGAYSVVLSNSVANTVSALARLTVDSSKVPGPAIQSHPSGVTVATGDRARLKVIATGAGVLTYQWYQGSTGVISAPVAGGSQATLTTSPLVTTTSFWVRVTDGLGRSTDSSSASITVASAPVVTATHQTVGPGYVAGGGVIITGIISYSGNAPSRITWSTLLPAGWKYLGSGGNDGGVRPTYESSDLLEWVWTTVPPSPIKFTFMASIPTGASGDQSVGSIISSQMAGSPHQTMAKPDPLVIRRLESVP
jgi:uncharacterized protein GlcG (DUF336 family)